MIWTPRDRRFDLTRRGIVMGVLNVTPDSFSDGGRFADCDAAVARALQMEAEGADIVDIGGESTRPGAADVPEDEEIRRVLPVVRAIRRRSGIALSIDTRKAAVARAALEADADIVNDVSALRDDPEMAGVVAAAGAGVVLMHMQGNPRTMQKNPHYDDVVQEIGAFFTAAAASAVRAGIRPEAIAVDPGIGFGKTAGHNLTLLRQLAILAESPWPLVLGVSRKSFLGRILGTDDLAARRWPTVALTAYGLERGARVFRVHDVRDNVQALRMTGAILEG